MILDMDTLYRIHSNEHSRYVTVRAHQHRHRPAPTPLANAQEMIDFSLTLSGNSRLILKVIHSYRLSDLVYILLLENLESTHSHLTNLTSHTYEYLICIMMS